jgi:hypothetical protein
VPIAMDFLKKKMKELLDDNDKKPEKKAEGNAVTQVT